MSANKPLTQCAASMGDGECVHKRCQSSVPGDRLFGTCPLPWHVRGDDEREGVKRTMRRGEQ